VKARFVTYAAAAVLTLGSVCAIQPTFAADAASPGTHAKPENMPEVQTGPAIPIPQYVQGNGPWANLPTRLPPKSAPIVGFGFCRVGVPNMSAACLGLNQLLRLLRFGA
jgi:hypothetical protein